MNSPFGLGIVIDLKDNASAGLKNIHDNFNQLDSVTNNLAQSRANTATALASTGFALQNVGDGFMRAGRGIVDTYVNAGKKVVEVGTFVRGTRITLDTLFGSAEEGEKAFEWTKEYAKTSMFNFKDLLPAMTMMKAVGIDIRKEVSTTSGQTQNLLNYAGDLAALFPNARNMYGTGVNATMGAMKEFIAEGNAISLKRGLGLDIEEILGEKKGETIAERTRQIADLTEKINAFGMTENMSKTPMVMLSNMADIFFNLQTMIAESGVMTKYTDLISKFSTYLQAIPAEEFKGLAQIIGNALVSLMSPLDTVVDLVIKGIDWFRALVKTNPALAETVLKIIAVAGALLVVIGVGLKFAGSLFMLSSAMYSFSMMSQSGISIFGLLGKAFLGLLPFIAIAGIFYYVWTRNIGGVQEKVKYFFNNSGAVMEQASVKMTEALDILKQWFEKALPYIDSALLGIVEVIKIAFGGVKEVLNTVLPPLLQAVEWFAVNVFDLFKVVFPYVVGFVQDAFFRIQDLWETVLKPVFDSLMNVVEIVNEFLMEVFPVIADIIELAFDAILEAWDNILKPVLDFLVITVRDFVVPVLAEAFIFIRDMVYRAFNVIRDVYTEVLRPIFYAIGEIIQEHIVPAFQKYFPIVVRIVKEVFDGIKKVWDTVLEPVFNTVITFIRDTLIPIFMENFPTIMDVVDTVFKAIVTIWDNVLKPVFEQIRIFVVEKILPIFDRVFPLVGNIIKRTFDTIRQLWEEILKPVFDALIKFIGEKVKPFIEKWFPVIGDVIGNVFNSIANIWETVLGPVFNAIVDFIQNVLIPKIVEYFPKIMKVVGDVFNSIKNVWDTVLWPTLKAVWWYISTVVWPVIKENFDLIWTIVKEVFDKIKTWWDTVLKPVLEMLWRLISETVWPKMKEAFDLIKEKVEFAFEKIKEVWEKVLKPALDAAKVLVEEVLMPAFELAFGVIKTVVETAFDAAEVVWRTVLKPVFDAILAIVEPVLKLAFETGFNAIKTVVETAFDAIEWVWNNVLSPVFDSIKEGIGWVIGKFDKLGDVIDKAKGWVESWSDKYEKFKDQFGSFLSNKDKIGGLQKDSMGIWYHAKGAVFSRPTFFNTNSGVRAVGEAGPEAVAPISVLMGYVRQAVSESRQSPIILNNVNKVEPTPVIVDSEERFRHRNREMPTSKNTGNSDYSVHFNQGSVVIQLADATNSSLEKAAEKLMKMIERKQQLKQMAVRNRG